MHWFENLGVLYHSQNGKIENQELWESMRTFYTLTPDWKTFTKPQRLFDFTGDDADMATIDVIIYKVNSKYYAIIKDERWPTTIKTGKTIRIASSDNLTGPYTNPGKPVTPAWREAPSVVMSPDKECWYLYSEWYPYHYTMTKLASLDSEDYTEVTINPPANGRHGCVIKIDEAQYNLISKYVGASLLTPTDLSTFISNSAFDCQDGWYGEPVISESCAEKFNCNFDVYQIINDIPNGWYRVSCSGFYRQGNCDIAEYYCSNGTESLKAFLYANEVAVPLQSIFSCGQSSSSLSEGEWTDNIYTSYGYVPNSMKGSCIRFDDEQYTGNKVYVHVTNSTIRFGVRKNTTIDSDWTIFDNFKLEYLGTVTPPNLNISQFNKEHPDINSDGNIDTQDIMYIYNYMKNQ